MKKVQKYVALMRGINVGGKNLIKMVDLKACFEQMGFTGVLTYIQSGNVIFEALEESGEVLTRKIEQGLSKRFNYASRVVVASHGQLQEAVRKAPKGFGSKPEVYRYDVMFLKSPLTAVEAMNSVRTRAGVDQAFPGKGVLYFSRLISKATQSYLSKVTQAPLYASLTIRNWNTTTKLLALMEEGGPKGSLR